MNAVKPPSRSQIHLRERNRTISTRPCMLRCLFGTYLQDSRPAFPPKCEMAKARTPEKAERRAESSSVTVGNDPERSSQHTSSDTGTSEEDGDSSGQFLSSVILRQRIVDTLWSAEVSAVSSWTKT
jgi:hypothetical protein